MKRLAWLLCLAAAVSFGADGRLRIATFRSDATPAMGEPLIWITPTVKIEDPLWVKGVVLDDGKERYVICALDWCGIGGATHLLFREKVAKAAGTDITHVMVQSVHQHTAPYIEGDSYAFFDKVPDPPLRMSTGFLEKVTDQLAAAVREATGKMQPFDRIGTSMVRVEQVASARRILINGKIETRYSTSGKVPRMAELPEGNIDPDLRTITFANGDKPIARLHFYATHPQTFCCDGRVSADFVGAAREAVERKDVFEVYFTGCGGDVTVGKYNNATVEAREKLRANLQQALEASITATRLTKVKKLAWRYLPITLPKKPAPEFPARLQGNDFCRDAIATAFAARKRPLDSAALEMGKVRILFLPGEPMLEFQRYAQGLGKGNFIAVAGYGDIAPGYLCTDKAFTEGGYEPSASNAAPGTEASLKEAIQKLLGRQAR